MAVIYDFEKADVLADKMATYFNENRLSSIALTRRAFYEGTHKVGSMFSGGMKIAGKRLLFSFVAYCDRIAVNITVYDGICSLDSYSVKAYLAMLMMDKHNRRSKGYVFYTGMGSDNKTTLIARKEYVIESIEDINMSLYFKEMKALVSKLPSDIIGPFDIMFGNSVPGRKTTR